MADNATAPASGTIFATDEIGGVHFPREKLIFGPDGTNSGDVSKTNPLPANPYAIAEGGATPGMLISGASTNATVVKGSAGTLYTLFVSNINAAVRYLKLYDKATSPTVGSDTPVQVYAIPGGTAGNGLNLPIPPQGMAFANGIGLALTTGVANSDTGAVSANEHVVSYSYK